MTILPGILVEQGTLRPIRGVVARILANEGVLWPLRPAAGRPAAMWCKPTLDGGLAFIATRWSVALHSAPLECCRFGSRFWEGQA